MTARESTPVACPTCRKRGEWLAGAWGPFCSRRCKLIDLGKWLGEEHVLSEPLRAEHLEHSGAFAVDEASAIPEASNKTPDPR